MVVVREIRQATTVMARGPQEVVVKILVVPLVAVVREAAPAVVAVPVVMVVIPDRLIKD